MRVELADRVIPRNTKGDPCFTTMGGDHYDQHTNESRVNAPPQSLLSVFTVEEITELVNRSLYQILYQKDAHAKRREEQSRLERPVKAALKIVHPNTPWSKATPQQVTDAMRYAANHPELVREEDR